MSARRSHAAAALALLAAVAGCTTTGELRRDVSEDVVPDPPTAEAVFDSIDVDDLMRHVEVLSSDEFEGRAPGTRGEDLTVAYLTGELASLGLEPGNPDGSYVQRVPLQGATSTASALFEFAGRRFEPAAPADWVGRPGRIASAVDVPASDLVFVGYGVVAPEHGWDDYKDVDVRGKTLLMLVGDPQVRGETGELDPALFRGGAMTYYGRWTYKYEIAAAKGAVAALVVHADGPAGYRWNVVEESFGHERFELGPAADLGAPGEATGAPAEPAAEIEGWVQHALAAELCAAGGFDLAELEALACTREFRPVALGGRASFRAQSQIRDVVSHNVVGLLRGSDPEVADELVVYTAHWDHLGVGGGDGEDRIFNGALDNATGTAGVLELADAFTHFPRTPRRSVLFMLVTAEEKGLLGSKHYAAHPLYPLEKTLANVNMDGLNIWGPTRDVEVVGDGNTTLEDLLIAAAVQQGRSVGPDTQPEKGLYYRSDHFSFAKQGVPALYVKSGTDYIGKPADFAATQRAQYLVERYHGVEDEIQPDWDLSGAVNDLWLLLRVGLNVANADAWPQWKPGSEFAARRAAMLEAAEGS